MNSANVSVSSFVARSPSCVMFGMFFFLSYRFNLLLVSAVCICHLPSFVFVKWRKERGRGGEYEVDSGVKSNNPTLKGGEQKRLE